MFCLHLFLIENIFIFIIFVIKHVETLNLNNLHSVYMHERECKHKYKYKFQCEYRRNCMSLSKIMIGVSVSMSMNVSVSIDMSISVNVRIWVNLIVSESVSVSVPLIKGTSENAKSHVHTVFISPRHLYSWEAFTLMLTMEFHPISNHKSIFLTHV